MFSSKKKHQEHEPRAAQDENTPGSGAAGGQEPTPPAAVPAEESVAAAAIEGEAPPANPLETELATAKDRYARLLADFDNVRKRHVREREEVVKRATEALIIELLPVIDHFDLALAAAADPDDPFVAGVRMVSDQLHAALAKFDAKPEDAVGQPFDPARHEALSEMPSDASPAGHVVFQLRKGWSLAGRFIRPAQVMLSSGPATPATAPADAPTPD